MRFSTQLLNKFKVKLPNVILSLTLPYFALTKSSQNVVRLFPLNKLHSLIFCPTYVHIGPLSVLVLPEQILTVLWKPSDDAGRSAIEYIITTTTTGMDYINSTSVKHPITSVPISGLPQYSAGTVSVWAKNPGAMSKPVVLRFRMVNIVTNGIIISMSLHSNITLHTSV